MKEVKSALNVFKKGELRKSQAIFKKYNSKITEVGKKFNNFVAHMSSEISHGSFFLQQKFDYPINIGAKVVKVADLLRWINCVAQPIQPLPSADNHQLKASGFFSSVIHQVNEPSITFSESASSSTSSESALQSFLAKDYNNFVATDSSSEVMHKHILSSRRGF